MKLQLLLITSVIIYSQLSFAAYIEKVKGKKALIVLDGMNVNKGDTVDAFDPASQKKTAIIKVTTVKDGKAIGQIVRGKVKINHEVIASGESATPPEEQLPTSRKTKKPSQKSTVAYGALFGVGFDTMEITIDNGPVEVIEKTGMGMSFLGAADMKLREWLTLRILAGMEQFNAAGDSAKVGVPTQCRNCETEITYFSLAGWGKFHFTDSFWLGLGLGLQHPMSITTNALDESTIKTSMVYGFGGGFDIGISDTMFVPLQIEYGMQPKSDQVMMSYYGARIGLMVRY